MNRLVARQVRHHRGAVPTPANLPTLNCESCQQRSSLLSRHGRHRNTREPGPPSAGNSVDDPGRAGPRHRYLAQLPQPDRARLAPAHRPGAAAYHRGARVGRGPTRRPTSRAAAGRAARGVRRAGQRGRWHASARRGDRTAGHGAAVGRRRRAFPPPPLPPDRRATRRPGPVRRRRCRARPTRAAPRGGARLLLRPPQPHHGARRRCRGVGRGDRRTPRRGAPRVVRAVALRAWCDRRGPRRSAAPACRRAAPLRSPPPDVTALPAPATRSAGLPYGRPAGAPRAPAAHRRAGGVGR